MYYILKRSSNEYTLYYQKGKKTNWYTKDSISALFSSKTFADVVSGAGEESTVSSVEEYMEYCTIDKITICYSFKNPEKFQEKHPEHFI